MSCRFLHARREMKVKRVKRKKNEMRDKEEPVKPRCHSFMRAFCHKIIGIFWLFYFTTTEAATPFNAKLSKGTKKENALLLNKFLGLTILINSHFLSVQNL